MLAPVAVAETCNLNLVAAGMDKLIIADIDAHMGNACAVGVFEKDKIANLWCADIV